MDIPSDMLWRLRNCKPGHCLDQPLLLCSRPTPAVNMEA